MINLISKFKGYTQFPQPLIQLFQKTQNSFNSNANRPATAYSNIRNTNAPSRNQHYNITAMDTFKQRLLKERQRKASLKVIMQPDS